MEKDIKEGFTTKCIGCNETILVSEDDVECEEIIDSGKKYFKFDFICPFVDCGHKHKDFILNPKRIREIKRCLCCNKRYICKNIGQTSLKSSYCSSRCRLRAYRRKIATIKRNSF